MFFRCMSKRSEKKRTMLPLSKWVSQGKTPFRVRFLRFVLAALVLLSISTISEAACWQDSLAKVDRDLLFMRSGAVYQLLDDPRLVAFWFPLSKITICEQTGYVDGQIVGYYEIRNADAVETVKAMAVR
jgi:hypothetical protein